MIVPWGGNNMSNSCPKNALYGAFLGQLFDIFFAPPQGTIICVGHLGGGVFQPAEKTTKTQPLVEKPPQLTDYPTDYEQFPFKLPGPFVTGGVSQPAGGF